MLKKNNIPDISVFFILLNDGNTHYFTVKKTKEIFKIYYNDFGYEYEADSIEFTKNSFQLKKYNGENIYNLQNYYKIMNQMNNQENTNNQPEIEMLYIDLELRKELLNRGQLKYDEDASKIPGIIYEPIQEKLDINKNEFFHEQIIDQDFYFDEELDEENSFEEESKELPHYTRVKTIQNHMYTAHRL